MTDCFCSIASDNFGRYRVVDRLDGRTSRPERRIPANLDAFNKKAVNNRSVGTQTDGTAKVRTSGVLSKLSLCGRLLAAAVPNLD